MRSPAFPGKRQGGCGGPRCRGRSAGSGLKSPLLVGVGEVSIFSKLPPLVAFSGNCGCVRRARREVWGLNKLFSNRLLVRDLEGVNGAVESEPEWDGGESVKRGELRLTLGREAREKEVFCANYELVAAGGEEANNEIRMTNDQGRGRRVRRGGKTRGRGDGETR